MLDVKGVFLIVVSQIDVVGVLGDVVLVGQKGPDAPELEDALAAVQDGQLIHAGKLLPQFLIIEGVGQLPPPALAGVERVDGLLAQGSRQLLEGGGLRSAQEQPCVHIADDGVGVVLIEGFQLGLCLEKQAGGNLTASDGCHQFLQPGDLSDVGRLVDEAAHMDRKPPAVHVIGFLAQQVEKLGIGHAD